MASVEPHKNRKIDYFSVDIQSSPEVCTRSDTFLTLCKKKAFKCIEKKDMNTLNDFAQTGNFFILFSHII